jgi:Uma2 family endonuclease
MTSGFALGDATAGEPIPWLEQNDCLTRDEFERRYAAMPPNVKAELIEGVVHMAAAVRAEHHGSPHFRFIAWLSRYEENTPGVVGYDNTTVRMDADSEPQPDIALAIESECGGQSNRSEDDYLEGAPELVAEISSSSASFDLHAKLRMYEKCGVKEYLVWRVVDKQIDWFIRRGKRFVRLTANDRGWLCSKVFPGLWLDVEAMLGGKRKAVAAALKEGLADPGHAEFVERLEARRNNPG